VAGLHEQIKAGVTTVSPDGLTPTEQHDQVQALAQSLMAEQQQIWQTLRVELRGQGIEVLERADLSDKDRAALGEIFRARLFPLLTPLAIDPAHPFPFIPNLGFAIGLKLKRCGDGKGLIALIPMPSQVERFIQLSIFQSSSEAMTCSRTAASGSCATAISNSKRKPKTSSANSRVF
jgi:polyphosphate kinase